MKKTVSVNISGVAFTIDEDAYEQLKRYLDTIRGYFNNSSSRDEIMADIEARIAEMLLEQVASPTNIISVAHVEAIIKVMGQPEDYLNEVEEEDFSGGPQNKSTNSKKHSTKRRLYRDPDSAMAGGVCSGIGYYFGIDPLWLRLAFIIALLVFGTGVIAYLILWAIIPKAQTAAEKLEMRGEPVNFENIGKTVEEEFESLKKKLNHISNDSSTVLDKFFAFIGELLTGIGKTAMELAKVLVKIVGFALAVVAVFGIVGLVIALFNYNDIAFDMANIGTSKYAFEDIAGLVLNSAEQLTWIFIAGIIMVLIPFVALLLGALRLTTNFSVSLKGFNLALFILWLISIAIISTIAVQTGKDFSKHESITKTIALPVQKDTLYLQSGEDLLKLTQNEWQYHRHEMYLEKRTSDFILGSVYVDVQLARGADYELEIEQSAAASTYKAAYKRAADINYKYLVTDSVLEIAPYLTTALENKLRDQELHMNILIPEGKYIYFLPESDRLFYGVRNKQNILDKNMTGHLWQMQNRELTCITCDTLQP